MTKLNNVAGIDISKEFFDVCRISKGVREEKIFSNDAPGINQALAWLNKEDYCVMEVTGAYYMRLATSLYQAGFKVSVVNPLIIKRFSQMRLMRTKTDKADARMIAEYGLSEPQQQWAPPPSFIRQINQLDGIAEQLQKHYTALANQLEAYTISGIDKETKQLLVTLIKSVRRKQQEIEKRIQEVITCYHAELMQRLCTIPGLGKKTVTMLIVITEGFKKFASYKQLSSYTGLCPRIFKSGSSIKGRGRICKMGMGRVRMLLYLCAWSAKKYNKACKDLYERLVEQGKSKRLALIAVANKLIKQAFAIAQSGLTYNPNY